MLKVLHEVEGELPRLLESIAGWHSLDINYHPPRVERLWRQYGDHRIYLHRIHPCTQDQALFHAHPWPSAIRLIEGTYEMGLGYAKLVKDSSQLPPIIATIHLLPGVKYEMKHRHGWHYVMPTAESTLSVMVTGPLFSTVAYDKSKEKALRNKPLKPLSEADEGKLLADFRKYYAVKPGL